MSDMKENSLVSRQKPLIFMHLPKTGGISLLATLGANWPRGIGDFYNISAKNPAHATRYLNDGKMALFAGHFSFGLHEWLDRPAYYISMLREPVARIVSLYAFLQSAIEYHAKLLKRAGGDVERLRANPRIADFYLDFLPCLEGGFCPENFLVSPSPELDNGMVRRFSGYGLNPEPCPESALDLAKENIERHFSAVGITERYQESLAWFSSIFGLPVLTEQHLNQSADVKESVDFDDALMAKIRAMNRLDIALYDWVCQRFDQQLVDAKAIEVPGGKRQDPPVAPLWRSVGKSPLQVAREKFREKNQKVIPVLCRRLNRVGVKQKIILADMDMLIQPGQPDQLAQLMRVAIPPAEARKLIDNLTKALAVIDGEQKILH